MRWNWVAGLALAVSTLALPASAEDMIGKGPVVIKAAPVEQSAINVANVVWLDKAEQTTKLFSITGGDPAINGEYLFLAVMPDDMTMDPAVFQIGDFNSWEIVEQTKDHVKLKIGRSWVEDSSGDIKSTEEVWTVPMVKADAKEITVTIGK